MAAYTAANLAAMQSEIIGKMSLDALKGNIGIAKLVNHEMNTDGGARRGTVIKVRKAPVYTAQSRASGSQNSDYTPNTETPGSVSITLADEAYVDIDASALANATVDPEWAEKSIKSAMTAIAQKIETDLLAAYSGFTYVGSSGVGSYGDAVTPAVVLSARQILFAAKAPINECVLAISGKDHQALLNQGLISSAEKAGSDYTLRTGEIAGLFGFNYFPSQFVKSSSQTNEAGQTITGYHNTAFHPRALTIGYAKYEAVQGAENFWVEDPDTGIILHYFIGGDTRRGTNMAVVRALYAIAVTDAALGVEIKG